VSRVARLGTRGSALARWQSEFIAAELQAQAPDLQVEIVEITSRGDVVTDQPLWQVEGTGFFTATIIGCCASFATRSRNCCSSAGRFAAEGLGLAA